METIYNKEYFIKKFEAIPTTDIGRFSLSAHCALHHVGVGVVDGKQTGDFYYTSKDSDNHSIPIITPESTALINLFGGRNDTDFSAVYLLVDDGGESDTPKERILNKLKSLPNDSI